VRTPRPAAVALALCLAMAAGLPAVWLLTRSTADIGTRPSADALPPPRTSVEASAPLATVADRADSPERHPPPGAVPTRVSIPAVGVDAAVVPVGVARDGAMRLPRDARLAVWYRFGSHPGSGTGSVVVAAHVDSRTQGLGAFYRLRDTRPGDRVTLMTDSGRPSAYRVVARELVRKRSLPLEDLFRRDGREVLTLITCGGRYLSDAGGYQDNVVVSAVPVRP
jgi:sortase (surface protein transpeptidase)